MYEKAPAGNSASRGFRLVCKWGRRAIIVKIDENNNGRG